MPVVVSRRALSSPSMPALLWLGLWPSARYHTSHFGLAIRSCMRAQFG